MPLIIGNFQQIADVFNNLFTTDEDITTWQLTLLCCYLQARNIWASIIQQSFTKYLRQALVFM